MPAQKPEQVNELLIAALTGGDVEAALALYEPEASFVSNGQTLTGKAAIRTALEGFVAIKPQFKMTIKPTTQTGDIALTGSHWSATGTGPDGSTLEMSGSSYEVVRRGDDGVWLFAIDIPDAG